MNGWKKAPIGDVVESPKTWNPSRSTSDKVFNYIDLSAVDQNSKLIVGAREVSCKEAPSRARQLVAKGDIIVSTVRPNLNGVAQVPEYLDGATASTGFCILRPRSSLLDGRFLFHWVKFPAFITDMVNKATGASYPAVSDRIILESILPLPSLHEQKRIADILDRVDVLRAKRKTAIVQLDELVQSIFIDMFGDPITNPKEWEICSIGALLADVTNGLTRRRKGSDEGTDIVLRLRDIREGWIDFSDVNRISLSYQESSRYKISVNDLLFIRVNGNPDYVGRCALFEGFSEPVYFNDHIMRVKTDQSKVDGKFLVYMLNGPRGKREIALHRKTSAGQHTINQDGLGKIEIPLPPLKIQQEFAFRTASIEKLKTVHRASLAELDEFFASLQYRAFRGEL